MKKIISIMLAIAMLCACMPMQIALAAENDILYNTIRTDFVLSEANGANAKMFMLKDGPEHSAGEGFTDYVKGLDYEGWLVYDSARQGVYPTGTSNDTYASVYGALVYTVDGKDNNDTYNDYANFVTKNGKLYWNIDGVDYLMNPEDKAIKLYSVRTDDVEDPELAARFNTLNGVTLDVEDGNYYEIGFLAAVSYNRTLNVTLMYKDGTTEVKNVAIPTNLTNVGQSTGSVFFQNLKTHAIAALVRRFKPYTVTSDTTKILDKVKLKSSSYANPILIISAWGEMPSVKSMLDKVTDVNALTEENYATAQAELDSFMSYLDVCGLEYADLDADMKSKVDTILNPFNQILSNMIAPLDENEQITGDNIYNIKAQLDRIDAFKTANSLSYTQQQQTKINTIKNNIAEVEEQVVLDDLTERISNLPAINEITVDNFSEISEKVKEINKIIVDNNVDESSITSIATLKSVENALDIIVQDMTATIPLNIQDGANAKLFLEKNEVDTNYVPWADYIASSFIGTVTATTTYTPRVLRYSETEPESLSLISAPNKIWSVCDIPFRIGNDVLGIRLHGARTVNSGDENLKKILNSYKEVTVNLEKGMYSKIHILAANPHGYDGDKEAEASYVLTYTDGEKREGKLLVHFNPTLENSLPSYGYIRGTDLDPNGTGVNINKYADYVIETNPLKQIDTIKFTCDEVQRTIYIAGISGETAKVSEVKSVIEDKLSYSIPVVGTAVKDTLLEIEDLVKEYESAGADSNRIEGISKFKTDIFEYHNGAIEVVGTKIDTDFENSYFEATFNKNIIVEDECVAVRIGTDEYLTSDKFTVEVEGNKLLVIIPDNHKESVAYTVEIAEGVQNAENTLFYTDKAISESFNSIKAVSIEKFELVDGTVTAVIKNNMLNKTQDYVFVIAAYDAENKKAGMRIISGTLGIKDANNSVVETALDASTFAEGVKIECYLADRINTLNYLDRVEAITVSVQ